MRTTEKGDCNAGDAQTNRNRTTTVIYGLARMYQILSEEHDPQIAVFRDIGEARAWLGLAPNEE